MSVLKRGDKFKVGDRVAFYDNGCRYTNTIREIDGQCTEQSILIGDSWYHPKQLRRLKPRAVKPPAQAKAREWELSLGTNAPNVLAHGPILKSGERVHVIEKLPNAVQVTREELEKAWDEHVAKYFYHDDGMVLDDFIKAIGLLGDSK
ncbi:unnamed protein product [Sphagnum balticum]